MLCTNVSNGPIDEFILSSFPIFYQLYFKIKLIFPLLCLLLSLIHAISGHCPTFFIFPLQFPGLFHSPSIIPPNVSHSRSIYLTLINSLSYVSSLLIYMELFCPWGKGFLWYSKGSSWAKKPRTAFVWCGQFYSHSIPWFQTACRSLNSKHPS